MATTTHEGRCYCGDVQFGVAVTEERGVFGSAYCHCDSCRRAHAAPLYHVVFSQLQDFHVTAGSENIVEFQKTPGRIIRAFCSRCGTRVYNRFPKWRPGGNELRAWFPNLLTEGAQQPMPQAFRPKRTNRPEECVLETELLREFLSGV